MVIAIIVLHLMVQLVFNFKVINIYRYVVQNPEKYFLWHLAGYWYPYVPNICALKKRSLTRYYGICHLGMEGTVYQTLQTVTFMCALSMI